MAQCIVVGNTESPRIVVVTEPPSERVYNSGRVMSPASMRVFQEQAVHCGFGKDDFCFITCSSFMPQDATTDSRINKFMDSEREGFLEQFEEVVEGCDLVIYLGKWAGRQVSGRAIKITEVRGQISVNEDFNKPVLPLLSTGNVLRRPENADIFETDFRLAWQLEKCGWDVDKYDSSRLVGKYKWCLDLSAEIDLDNPPIGMSLDAEWRTDNGELLTVQLSWEKDQSVVIPLNIEYFNDDNLRGVSNRHLPKLTLRSRLKLVQQLRKVCSNSKVFFVGHNFKGDKKKLREIGVLIENWLHDTMQLAFCCDDNMQKKSLSECVRRWLPALAGYSDVFDKQIDKLHMELVPHDPMCMYGGGDADATRQLCQVLVPIAKEDKANYRCYTEVQMPALRAFFHVEKNGIEMSTDSLTDLAVVAGRQEEELRTSLLEGVSGKIKRKYLQDPKNKSKTPQEALSFGCTAFVIDILFGSKRSGGFGLKPKVFTKGTRRLPPEDRIPSTSTKEHLPYFEDIPFVADFINYKKLSKLRSTYIGLPEHQEYIPVPLLKSGVKYQKKAQDILNEYDCEYAFLPPVDGEPEEVCYRLGTVGGKTLILDAYSRPWWSATKPATGFWQYLDEDNKIHPNYLLHATVTGRSASRNPNGQNIPKRGATPMMEELVKAYRRCFVAGEGYVFIEVDLSQAELRLVAWMAQEPTMLEIYRNGGDIHSVTASAVIGMPPELFASWKGSDEPLLEYARQFQGVDDYLMNLTPEQQRGVTVGSFYKMSRFRAKAVNFGFMYGMWWKGFRTYAKTDYGIDMSEAEAEAIYDTYFNTYTGLRGWHKGMKDFAKQRGYVRALHGALRRLPSVYSDDEGIQKGAQRQAINSPIQRFASDIGLMGMTRMIEGVWVAEQRGILEAGAIQGVGFIHDATILRVREELAEEASSALKWCLETVPLQETFGIESPIPLLADINIGHNLADMDERPELQAVQPQYLLGV